MFAFPVLKLGRMSFNPRYGDQKFGVDFLAGSLSGMSLKPLRVQGFSLATAQGDNSFTLMLGQVRGKGSNALCSAVPRVLALTGTLKASPRSHNRPSSRHAPREAHTAWECRQPALGQAYAPTFLRMFSFLVTSAAPGRSVVGGHHLPQSVLLGSGHVARLRRASDGLMPTTRRWAASGSPRRTMKS